MKVSELYQSPYIKAEDLNGKAHRVKVAEVGIETFTDMKTQKEQSKLVLYFEGRKKALPLNKTQASAAAAVLGDDVGLWVGHELIISPGMTHNGQSTVVVSGSPVAQTDGAGASNGEIPF